MRAHMQTQKMGVLARGNGGRKIVTRTPPNFARFRKRFLRNFCDKKSKLHEIARNCTKLQIKNWYKAKFRNANAPKMANAHTPVGA